MTFCLFVVVLLECIWTFNTFFLHNFFTSLMHLFRMECINYQNNGLTQMKMFFGIEPTYHKHKSVERNTFSSKFVSLSLS